MARRAAGKIPKVRKGTFKRLGAKPKVDTFKRPAPPAAHRSILFQNSQSKARIINRGAGQTNYNRQRKYVVKDPAPQISVALPCSLGTPGLYNGAFGGGGYSTRNSH